MKAKSKKSGTQTSTFGSPGRIGNDASRFYGGRLYEGLAQEAKGDYRENPVPSDALNANFCKSAEDMSELPDMSVHLTVTSPPYNVRKDYDEDLTLEEYLAFLKRVWLEVHRVLVPGGRACINVANLGRRPYIPLHAFIIRDLLDLEVDVETLLPKDDAAHGFDNVTVGDLSPTLLERYIAAAQKISRRAVGASSDGAGATPRWRARTRNPLPLSH